MLFLLTMCGEVIYILTILFWSVWNECMQKKNKNVHICLAKVFTYLINLCINVAFLCVNCFFFLNLLHIKFQIFSFMHFWWNLFENFKIIIICYDSLFHLTFQIAFERAQSRNWAVTLVLNADILFSIR